jgi:hypothetical protein
LDLHRNDLAGYPLTVEAVATFIPVARRLFYKDDPEIASLLDRIRRPSGEGPSTPARIPEQPEVGDLDNSALEQDIAKVVACAVWAMQKYVGHLKAAVNRAVEAALAAHDPDEVLGVLGACQRDRRPLVREHIQRRKESVGAAVGTGTLDPVPDRFDVLPLEPQAL